MRITKTQLKQLIKEEIESTLAEASPRSAMAFATQVAGDLEPVLGKKLRAQKTDDHGAMRSDIGGRYMSPSDVRGEGSQVTLPMYSIQSIFTGEELDSAKAALENKYGNAQTMTMGVVSKDVIPVGKYAIVFTGKEGMPIGISKIL
tara:strand:- start:310 stop:747 length:438 start_codon:yes stop_codon:yes gene_type:complete